MEVLLYNSTICRLCAQENSNGILIFENNDERACISQFINRYLPLKVTDDGKYPCTICPGCNIQLEATMQFLELIVDGQSKLRELYKQQQDELKRLQKGTKHYIINKSKEIPNIVQTILIQQDNGQAEEIFVQLLPTENIYPNDHEQFLKAEGLEKPRRKRGRPPKPPTIPGFNEEQHQEKPNSSVKEDIPIEEESTLSTKRRRKIPTRLQEAVQGKELEKIFREEGVIDENESDDNDEANFKPNMNSFAMNSEKTEVIGRLESHDGEGLGELVIVNHQRRTRRNRFYRRRRHVCDICGAAFIHISRYNIHKAQHKTTTSCECAECKASFETKDELQQHQKETKHTGENEPTEHAGEKELDLPTVMRTENVDSKENIITDAARLQCNLCIKSFVTKQGLEAHLKGIHEKQRPYSCQTCNKKFAYIASLKSHLLSHQMKANRGYPCDICGKVFNHPSSIIYHKQSEHNNGRRFVCNKCNKSFKHKQLLQRHQLVHSNQRPFTCKICDAQFKAKSNLLNHQLTHSGLKKFFCEQCGQQFAHKTSLKLHYRWHTGQKPYQCVFCEKSFSQNGNLQEHIRIHTGLKPYSCKYCEKKFTTSSQFKLHVKRHTGERPWTCNVCNKTFLTKETWRCHSRRHVSDKPFTCTTCNRGFIEQLALKKHMRTHTGEKPYVCNICTRAFSDCSNLAKHKRIHNKPLHQPVWSKICADINNATANAEITNDLGQIYYVTYNENVEENSGETVKLDQNSSKTSNAVINTELTEQDIMSEDNVTISNIQFTGEQLEVTDEFGNPINFTTKDGDHLRVTTYDGEQLQVLTSDGSVLPVELAVENGRTVAVEREDNKTENALLETAEAEVIPTNDNKTIEFLAGDVFNVQLITADNNLETTEYLTVV